MSAIILAFTPLFLGGQIQSGTEVVSWAACEDERMVLSPEWTEAELPQRHSPSKN